MITITRSMARLVRAVFRKALGITALGRLFTVLIETGSGGLVFRSRSFNMAAEYRLPGEHPGESLAVPFELLEDCEGRTDKPVQLTRCGKGTTEAQWSDGSIPQVKQYVVGKAEDVLKNYPPVPGALSENQPGLLAALRDAADTSDSNPTRYALNKVQLRGTSGAIGATDGRHLLLQQGFAFPWEEDLLIPASRVFSCKELSGAPTIYIGRSENWVSLVAGQWTYHFQIDKEGRFPKLDDHIRPALSAQTRLQVSDGDALSLAQSLDRLPCDDDNHFAVTVDFNGQAIIRAKASDQQRATELVLTGSSCSGSPLAISMNRNYLARALKLGFRELLVFSEHTPVLCQDQHRSFAWAPLDPQDAIKPGKDPIRIESGAPPSAVLAQSPQQKRRVTMPRRKATDYGVVPVGGTNSETSNASTNATGNVQPNEASNGTSNGAPSNEPAGEPSLIDQAEAARMSLRQSMDKVGDLIVSLKRHRKQSQLVRNTLASLKQLQTLDA